MRLRFTGTIIAAAILVITLMSGSAGSAIAAPTAGCPGRGATQPNGVADSASAASATAHDLASDNWSGYVQLSTGTARFTAVQSSWVVPRVDTKVSGSQYSSEWIGVGGFCHDGVGAGNTKLIQAGTATRNVNGKAEYYAWTEILPAHEKPISTKTLTIHPGDQMWVWITETASTAWMITVQDVTTEQVFSTTLTYSSHEESAEAIYERPTINGKLAKLTKLTDSTIFGVTTAADDAPSFLHTYLHIGSSIPGARLYRIAMVARVEAKGERVIAVPSDLAHGECFAVKDGSKAPAAPAMCFGPGA